MTTARAAGLGDHADVVGDHDEGEAETLGELGEQVADLRLHDDVERGRGLVGEQHLGLAGERHGDHGALAHAAGELVRVAARHRGRQADELEQLAVRGARLGRARAACGRPSDRRSACRRGAPGSWRSWRPGRPWRRASSAPPARSPRRARARRRRRGARCRRPRRRRAAGPWRRGSAWSCRSPTRRARRRARRPRPRGRRRARREPSGRRERRTRRAGR